MKLFSGGCNNNYLGVGVLLLNDRLDGLSNLTGMLSLAYHRALDREGNYHLAVGMQGGIVQKSFDFEKLNNGLGNNGLTAQQLRYYQISYMDVAAGVALYGVPNNHSRFQIGASVFHLNTPKETFFETSNNQVDMRYVVHGSLAFRAGKKLYFFPCAQYQFQNHDNELVYGANFGVNMKQSAKGIPPIFYIGAFNRLRNDVIPTAGIMIKGFHAGLSYDVNIANDESPTTGGMGGFELALTYTGNIHRQNITSAFCPSF